VKGWAAGRGTRVAASQRAGWKRETKRATKSGLEIGRLDGIDHEDGVDAWGPSARGRSTVGRVKGRGQMKAFGAAKGRRIGDSEGRSRERNFPRLPSRRASSGAIGNDFYRSTQGLTRAGSGASVRLVVSGAACARSKPHPAALARPRAWRAYSSQGSRRHFAGYLHHVKEILVSPSLLRSTR
jgi:hypothetical protein